MLNKKIAIYGTIIALVMLASGVFVSESIANEHKVTKIMFHPEMPDLIHVKAGHEKTVPVIIHNTDARQSDVSIYVTSQEREGWKTMPQLAMSDNGISIEADKTSVRLTPALEKGKSSTTPLNITVSVSKDTPSGQYDYSLISEQDGKMNIKYFYVIVK